MNEPLQHKSRAWLPIAVLATSLTYLLSFGPACWMASRSSEIVSCEFVEAFYLPVVWVCWYSPPFVTTCLVKYANFGGSSVTTTEITDKGVEFWDHYGGPISLGNWPSTGATSGPWVDVAPVAAEAHPETESP